jgi:hypothetical protein
MLGAEQTEKQNEMRDDPKPEDPARKDRARDGLEPAMEADVRPHKGTARLGHDIQAKIGQQLRAVYADVVDQGVPERFVELLQRLDEARKKTGDE